MWTSGNEDKGEERAEDDEMNMCYERERGEPQSGVSEYMCEEEENMEEKMIRIDWEEMLKRIGDISMSVVVTLRAFWEMKCILRNCERK